MSSCPICKAPTAADYRPFCSRRCADVDLGRWFNGAYSVPSFRFDEGDDGEDEKTASHPLDPTGRLG